MFHDGWTFQGDIEQKKFLVAICQKINLYGNEKDVNVYRFRALAVTSHGPAHTWFGMIVAVFPI